MDLAHYLQERLMKKLMIFLVSMIAVTNAFAESGAVDVRHPIPVWPEPERCQSVTKKTQFIISRLYSVTQDSIQVSIIKATKGADENSLAVRADVRIGRATCTLAWLTDLDSCAGDLKTLMCAQL